jgi:hypothetical protein
MENKHPLVLAENAISLSMAWMSLLERYLVLADNKEMLTRFHGMQVENNLALRGIRQAMKANGNLYPDYVG